MSNPDVKNKYEQTPLHLAIEAEHKKIANLLIDKGANLDTKDSAENTLLHSAVRKGNKALVKILVGKGARNLLSISE